MSKIRCEQCIEIVDILNKCKCNTLIGNDCCTRIRGNGDIVYCINCIDEVKEITCLSCKMSLRRQILKNIRDNDFVLDMEFALYCKICIKINEYRAWH